MLNKIRKSKSEGFTIIEVMIVLAIAGLIILIVLLAVPALQRNGRNTAIKNDASALSAAIQRAKNRNQGIPPNRLTVSGSKAEFYNSGTPGYARSAANINASTSIAMTPTRPRTLQPGQIRVYAGGNCPASLGGNGQNSRAAFAIYYSVETRTSRTLKCLSS